MFHIFKTRQFFSNKDKEKIIEAIRQAESLTSGEIRVHVESKSGKEPLIRAQEVFTSLGMIDTELRNGVMIYLAIKERKFAIIGDQGIDKVVPKNFWEETKDRMKALFKDGKFVEGICLGISLTGEHLAAYFPCQPDDINELSNEISEGN
jgi:uncharacterized membrane protein